LAPPLSGPTLAGMLAAIHLVLWGQTNGLNVALVPPLITWLVLIGGCYGFARMLFDLVRALRHDGSKTGRRPD
jgi:hypothetical protein